MSQEVLISELSEVTGFTKASVKAVLKALPAVLFKMLRNGSVRITDLGIFSVKDRPARTGRNPKDGSPVEIAAKRVLHFKPSKNAKDVF